MNHNNSDIDKIIMSVRLSAWSRLLGMLGGLMFLSCAVWSLIMFARNCDSEYRMELVGMILLILGVFSIMSTFFQRIIVTERSITKRLIFSRTFNFDDIKKASVSLGHIYLHTGRSLMEITKGYERQHELIQTLVNRLSSRPDVKITGEDKALKKYGLIDQ